MNKGLIGVLSTVIGAAAGGAVVGYTQQKKIEQKAEKVDKFKTYYNMLNQWLLLKQDGKSLEDYFLKKGYETIAIYGMGEMGNRLYDELKNSKVRIAYAIDKKPASTYSEIDVKGADDELDEVDAVIVSAVFAYDEIEEELADRIDCPIISLEDVVFES